MSVRFTGRRWTQLVGRIDSRVDATDHHDVAAGVDAQVGRESVGGRLCFAPGSDHPWLS
jgi:hypothetical protein